MRTINQTLNQTGAPASLRTRNLALQQALNLIPRFFKWRTRVAMLIVICGLGVDKVQGATPYVMAGGNYSEGFADIANWTDNFAAGIGASRWSSVGIIGTGTSVTTGTRTTKSSATFVSGASGGIQKGSGNLVFLSTGSTTTPEAVAVDLLLDFTGRNAGTLSFDWAAIDNASGTRPTSMRVFWSTDNSTFTEITAAQVLDVQSVNSGSISAVSLPSQFNNSSTARLRFYNHAGTITGSGNRDKISIDNISVTATCGTIMLSPTTLPNGTAAASYNQTITSSGGAAGAYTYAVTSGSLPAGLSLSSGGVLSGTPTSSTAATFTVTATDSGSPACTDSRSYTLTPACPTITASPTSLPDGTQNSAYNATVSASGANGSYTFSVSSGSLPTGLTLNSSTGLIDGTPSAAASYNFTITATDTSGCTGNKPYTVIITAPCTPPTIDSTVPVSATCNGGSDGSITVNASGGLTAYEYSKDNGSTWQSANQFTGLSAATYQIKVRGSDLCASSASATTVTQPTAITFTPAQVNVTCNGGSDGNITVNSAAGGSGSGYQYSKDNGSTWQAGNQFTGLTPTTYQIKVMDGNGCISNATGVTITQPAAVTVNPTSPLPGGTAGSAYSQTIAASGGSGTGYTFTVTSGSLPTGLTLNSSTGVIDGMPTTPATNNFTVTITDSAGCTSNRSYALTITLPATAIASQGFETSGDSWAFAFSGGSASASTGASDTPASSRILAGSQSWQVNNTNSTLTFNPVTTTPYSSISVTVRVSSTSGTTGNGADAADTVKVFVALNGGAFSASSDITLSGNNNARYGYNASQTATTQAGTTFSVAATSGDSTANYSTLKITVPDGTTSVALKVVALNNNADEFWNFDSITLTGTPTCSAPPITTQPTDQTVCSGSHAQFTVATSASSPSYQWRKNGVNLSNAGHDSGVTTVTLTINPADSGDAAAAGVGYDCVVSVAGGCSTTSEKHALTVNAPATVNAGADQLIQAGSTATLAGSIGGGASSATWSGGAGTFAPDGTTLNATYTPSSSEVTAGTATLTLTTDDPSGPCPVVSDTMVITINRAPVANTDAITRHSGTSGTKVSVATLLSNDTDADNNTLSISAVSGTSAQGASISQTGGFIVYTTATPINVDDSFTYTASDGFGGTAVGTVSVTISSTNTGQSSNLLPPDGGPGDITINFAGIPGRTYSIQWASSVSGPWTTLGTATANSNTGLGSYHDTVNHGGTAFYRTVYP